MDIGQQHQPGLSNTGTPWATGLPATALTRAVEMAENFLPLPACQLLKWREISHLFPTVSCWMPGNILHLPDCHLLKWREISHISLTVSCWKWREIIPLPDCQLLTWLEMTYLSSTVSCWNGGKSPTSPRLSAVGMAGNVLPLPDCQLLKWREIS